MYNEKECKEFVPSEKDKLRGKKYGKIMFKNIDSVQKIGEGTFGNVYKAIYTDEDGSKHEIAIKKFKTQFKDGDDPTFKGQPIPTYREIKYLKLVDHENILKLREIIHSRPSKSQSSMLMGSLYLIFDFLKYDLQGLMNTPSIKFDLP